MGSSIGVILSKSVVERNMIRENEKLVIEIKKGPLLESYLEYQKILVFTYT